MSPNRPPGAFCGLRLLTGEAAPGTALYSLMGDLVVALLQDPPYDLRWLKGVDDRVKV